MYKFKHILFITMIFLLIIASTTLAAEISLEPMKMGGHNTYVIKGEQSGGFKSELIFPMNVTAIEIEYSLNVNSKYISIIKFKVKRNLEKEAGKFLDSDWLYRYQDEKAIYSESDSYLDFYTLNPEFESSDIAPSNWKNTKIKFLAGYIHQYLDYEIENLHQVNYLNGNRTEVEGKVLTYELTYQYPYAGLQLFSNDSNNKIIKWDLGVRYSPLVRAEDRDIHLLRDKVTIIRAKGDAWEIEGNFSYEFKDEIYLNLNLSYLKIGAEGTQIQKNYEDEVLFEDIEASIESDQKSASLGVMYNF